MVPILKAMGKNDSHSQRRRFVTKYFILLAGPGQGILCAYY